MFSYPLTQDFGLTYLTLHTSLFLPVRAGLCSRTPSRKILSVDFSQSGHDCGLDYLTIFPFFPCQGKIVALDNSRLVLLPWGTQFPLHKMGWARERVLWVGALKVGCICNIECVYNRYDI